MKNNPLRATRSFYLLYPVRIYYHPYALCAEQAQHYQVRQCRDTHWDSTTSIIFCQDNSLTVDDLTPRLSFGKRFFGKKRPVETIRANGQMVYNANLLINTPILYRILL